MKRYGDEHVGGFGERVHDLAVEEVTLHWVTDLHIVRCTLVMADRAPPHLN